MLTRVPTVDEIVAWAHRPTPPPPDVLGAIDYRNGFVSAARKLGLNGFGAILYVLSPKHDRNSGLRSQVLARLMLGELPRNHVLLEALLQAEIDWHETMTWHMHTISMACYLNAMARPMVSTPAIWAAKCCSDDNHVMIDAEFCVVGGGVQPTLAYLAGVEGSGDCLAYLSRIDAAGWPSKLEDWRLQALSRLKEDAAEILSNSSQS